MTLFKQTLRTLFLFTLFFIGGCIIEFLKQTTNSMPEYAFITTLLCFLGVAWVYMIKLIKGNGGF